MADEARRAQREADIQTLADLWARNRQDELYYLADNDIEMEEVYGERADLFRRIVDDLRRLNAIEATTGGNDDLATR